MFGSLFRALAGRTKAASEKGIKISVVGESFENDDGSDRQDIIERLKVGDEIELRNEPDNLYDKNAIAVFSRHGQIGYIGRDDTAIIHLAKRAERYRGADIDFIGENRAGMLGVVLCVWIESD